MKMSKRNWFWTVSAASLISIFAVVSPAITQSDSKTIGLVLTDWHMAMSGLEDTKECPEGFQYDNNEQWAAQFPTEVEQREHISKYFHRQNFRILNFNPLKVLTNVPDFFLKKSSA